MFLNLLKTSAQYVIPKQGITAWASCLANVKNKKVKNYIIQRFIKNYNVNMSEAFIEDPEAYESFNEFFIRHLKSECRPLAEADIISPVDGCVSELGVIEGDQLIQAKNHRYSVTELLACDNQKADAFTHGRFATFYLSPKDYHRVHLPVDAELVSMTYIPGTLFSVQPATVDVIPKLFARNERLVLYFSTQTGPMALVMVGAIIVGAIGTSWHGDIQRSKNRVDFDYSRVSSMNKSMRKGDELGYFKLGSTVVLLFSPACHMEWKEDLKAGSSVRFGQEIGNIVQ